MAKKKKWIAGAIKRPGALKSMAKAAGFKSWRGFCAQPKSKLSTLAKRRCALARTLGRMR